MLCYGARMVRRDEEPDAPPASAGGDFDLELDLGPRRPPPVSAGARAGDHGGQLAPELEAFKTPSLAPPPPKGAHMAAPAAPPFDEALPSVDFGGAIDLASTGSTGSDPAPRVPQVKPVSSVLMSEDGGRARASQLADYGDAPDGIWKAPFYAYRVKMRQLELRRALADRRVELENAQGAADDALIVLAERARKQVQGSEAYSKLLGAVIVAENALRERDSAMAAELEAHAKATAGLDGQIARHEAELAGARAEEKSHQVAFDRVDAVRQRADAKVKRIDIDLRNAQARASVQGLPASTAAADPDVVARTAEREARLEELQQSLPAVTEANQKLSIAKKKVDGIEQKMLGVKNQRAALENQFRKRGAAHGAAVQKAQEEVRIALAAMGRAVAGDYNTFGVEWTESRAEIAKLDKATADRDDEVMVHVMALDVHDAKVVSKGMGLVVAFLVLLVLAITAPILVKLIGGTAPPPPPVAPIDPE